LEFLLYELLELLFFSLIIQRSFVGILSSNRAEWCVVDFACALYNHVLVPLAMTNSDDQLQFIIDHAEITVIVASRSECSTRLPGIVKNSPSVKWIIYLDEVGSEIDFENCEETSSVAEVNMNQENTQQGFVELCYRDLLRNGRNALIPPQDAVNENDMVSLLYTSGSTNRPKGISLFYSPFSISHSQAR
jgi:long-chain acyl-CoA synthetase